LRTEELFINKIAIIMKVSRKL